MAGIENPLTQTALHAPDVLMNRPLDRQVDVSIETNILEPVSHSFVSANGGRTRFVLPKRGVLDASECALAFELLDTQGAPDTSNLCFPLHSGALATVNRCTLRSGTQILSQVVNAGEYATMKTGFNTYGYREGILDAYHLSSSVVRNRVLPAKIAVGAASQAFHQIYNVEADQVDEFGRAYNGGAANSHQAQKSKCLKQTAGRGPEAVIRLADIFPIFASGFKLPLLGMAQVELEIEWTRSGQTGIAGPNIVNCNVVSGGEDAANTYENNALDCTTTMTTPFLIMDLHHFDDEETQKIIDAIDSPAGMALDFTEVVVTKGVNPAITDVQDAVTPVASQHLLGMSMKEVQNIYVIKDWALNTTQGIIERAHAYPNADPQKVQMEMHRNPVLRQLKSQQMFGEQYNFVINNNRVYAAPISNVATAYNQLNQTDVRPFNVPPGQYDTTNYNQAQTQILLSSECQQGVAEAPATGAGFSHKYLAGTSNVIGLNLEKNVGIGPTRGNGMRIGSAPIQFEYQALKLGTQATVPITASQCADIDLTFFIEYRRSLIINSLGCTVSDA